MDSQGKLNQLLGSLCLWCFLFIFGFLGGFITCERKIQANPAPQNTPATPAAPTVPSYKITAYCPCAKCCGKSADGITASGHKIKEGDVFVAAPRSIPIGTKLIIPGYNNSLPVKVLDRGGAIKEGRMDVFFGGDNGHRRALEWGIQQLPVVILPTK